MRIDKLVTGECRGFLQGGQKFEIVRAVPAEEGAKVQHNT